MTTCSQFACCVSLIDAGSHPLGNSQWGKQIFIGFELLLPLQLTSVSKEIVFGAYELSWSSGAIFKVTMERLMGHDWHEDSVRRFDPKAVLGRNCVLRFTCNQRGRNSISDFDVHPLPDGVNHTDLPKA